MRGRRRLVGVQFTRPYVERMLWSAGIGRVAGVDEVGMGPLAGPVVAAAVTFERPVALDGVADSKLLSAAARARAAAAIRALAAGIGVGAVSADEVDRLNVYQAGLKAMRLAVEALPRAPEYVLVDARTIPALAMPQIRYIGGDRFVHSIAAASIIAKEHRDALMRELDGRYPEYGFRHHLGYATRAHLAALRAFGPCPLHRRSFAPCRSAERGTGGRSPAPPPG